MRFQGEGGGGGVGSTQKAITLFAQLMYNKNIFTKKRLQISKVVWYFRLELPVNGWPLAISRENSVRQNLV